MLGRRRKNFSTIESTSWPRLSSPLFLFYAALSSPQCAVVSGCVGPAIACGLIGGYIAAPLLVFWMSLYDDYFSDRAIQEIDRAVETFHPQNLSRFSPLNNIQALRKREILDEATASHMHRLTLFYGQKEFEAEWEAWEQLKGRLSQNMRPPDTIQPS